MGKTTVNLEPETPFHALTVDQVAKHYNTSVLEGLSSQEATQRLQTYGANELEGDGGIKWYKVLWRQFANVLVCVLLVAAVSTHLRYLLSKSSHRRHAGRLNNMQTHATISYFSSN